MAIEFVESIEYRRFLEVYLCGNDPVLIGATSMISWPLFRSWFSGHEINYAHLRSTYGHHIHSFINCRTQTSREGTLGEMLDLWEKGEGREEYARDLHLPLLVRREGRSVEGEMYEVMDVCRDDWMNSSATTDDFRFVYMGGADTATLLHKDVYSSYSISTQIHGSKHWTLFPPALTPEFEQMIKAAEHRGEEGVDIRSFDERRERWREAGMRECVQGKGETLFVPSGWYHQVENLTNPTISLNHNWCNSTNLVRMYDAFCVDVEMVRGEIWDVREMILSRRARQNEVSRGGKEKDVADNEIGEDGDEVESGEDMVVGEETSWEVEWEQCVGELMRQNSGWNWLIFWRMIHHALSILVHGEQSVANPLGWPNATSDLRPGNEEILNEVTPILAQFLARKEGEYHFAAGVKEVVDGVAALLCCEIGWSHRIDLVVVAILFETFAG